MLSNHKISNLKSIFQFGCDGTRRRNESNKSCNTHIVSFYRRAHHSISLFRYPFRFIDQWYLVHGWACDVFLTSILCTSDTHHIFEVGHAIWGNAYWVRRALLILCACSFRTACKRADMRELWWMNESVKLTICLRITYAQTLSLKEMKGACTANINQSKTECFFHSKCSPIWIEDGRKYNFIG